jgi:hypothetical protein
MCMPLEHRLQILLDEDRHARITRAAEERGVSVATIVREAIDRGIPVSGSRAAAAERLLEAPDMDVPDVGELVAELDALRARRA